MTRIKDAKQKSDWTENMRYTNVNQLLTDAAIIVLFSGNVHETLFECNIKSTRFRKLVTTLFKVLYCFPSL